MARKKKASSVAAGGLAESGQSGQSGKVRDENAAQSKRVQDALRSAPVDDDGDDDSDSETESSEDELAVALTRKVDDRIRETLRAIQERDPRVYDGNHHFFGDDGKEQGEGLGVRKGQRQDDNNDNNEDGHGNRDSDGDEPVAGWEAVARQEEAKAAAAARGMTIKDYVRERIVKDGTLHDDDDESDRGGHDNESKRRLLYNKEQKRLKEALKADNTAADTSNSSDESQDDSSSDEDTFFTKKDKSEAEIAAEEADFELFSRAEQERVRGRATGEDILLHSYLEKETMDEKERFLRDFVLNNGWIEKNAGDVPLHQDYEIEIDGAGQDEQSQERTTGSRGLELDQDEDFLDKQDDFENKFNFRFEDEGAGHKIQSFGRQIPEESLRRKDDARKRARQAKKLRKEEERRTRDEELKRVKNVKKAELREKLQAIEQISGGVSFEDVDLDADFDPETFSKQMEAKFNDDFYNADCDADDAEFGDGDRDFDSEDGDMMAVAADEHEHEQPNQVDDKESQRKKREAEKLLDEYYKLDYEDVVGGEETRFNYRQVEPENFGLSQDHILALEDKKLNQLASIKYLAAYRDSRSIPRKAKFAGSVLKQEREKERAKTHKSAKTAANPGDEKPAKKAKKKSLKESKSKSDLGKNTEKEPKHKKRRKRKASSTTENPALPSSRLAAYQV